MAVALEAGEVARVADVDLRLAVDRVGHRAAHAVPGDGLEVDHLRHGDAALLGLRHHRPRQRMLAAGLHGRGQPQQIIGRRPAGFDGHLLADH